MLDPDLQKQFDLINSNLVDIKIKKHGGIWRSFFNGMFGALGYLVGIVLVFALAGWILAKTGLIAPVEEQWQKFQTFMSQAENTLSATQPQSQQQTQEGGNQNGSYMITLPNGQKAEVIPQ